MQNINTRIKNILFRETANSNLVGVIAVLIISASFLGNTSSKGISLKSNLMESIKSKNEHNSFIGSQINNINLTIGKQTVFINGQEFIIDIVKKF